jgi:hypothetical protein
MTLLHQPQDDHRRAVALALTEVEQLRVSARLPSNRGPISSNNFSVAAGWRVSPSRGGGAPPCLLAQS